MLHDISAWFNRQRQRIPLFVQGVFSYLLVVLIMISTMLLVVERVREITVERYLDERRFSLQTSVAAFEREIANYNSIGVSMNTTEYYRPARFMRSDSAIENKYYYTFYRLASVFGQRCIQLINAQTSFIYLPNSDSVIWRDNSYSFDASRYLDRIILSGDDSMPLTAFIRSVNGDQHLRTAVYTDENGRSSECLLYLYSTATDKSVYGMLLTASDLEKLFRLSDLPENSYLTLSDALNGKTVYQTGTPRADCTYHTLENEIASVMLTASVSIPQGYFTVLTRPILWLLTSYVLITAAVCLLLSMWLSHNNAARMRRLLQAFSNVVSPDEKCKNEFALLDHNIRLNRQHTQQLQQLLATERNALQTNILSRLMVQETYSKVDEGLAKQHLPSYADGARILCIELSRSDGELITDMTSLQSRLTLESVLPGDSRVIPMRLNLFAVLLHDQGGCLQRIPLWMEEVNDLLSPIGLSANAGVSERFTSLSILHDAYLHALYTLRYNATPPLSIYEPPKDDSQLHFADLGCFRNAVITCDEKTSVALLEQFMQVSYQYRWLMPSVRFMLDSVCSEMRLDAGTMQSDSLQTYTTRVINALIQKQKNVSVNALSENVMRYLQESFADASLSSDSVAEKFNVSRSYLYRIFRESYGMTPSDKLEQIRMQHAQKLLTETEMNVTDIASACGYNSSNTFYKAYKKRFGCAPNASRGAKASRDALAGDIPGR